MAIAKLVKSLAHGDAGVTIVTCSSNAAVTAGRLATISTAASTIVPNSVASVANAVETSTDVLGIFMNSTTGNGLEAQVLPLSAGDIINIQYTGNAPTPGTRYGLSSGGLLAAANTTGAYALYRVIGNVNTTTTTCDARVCGLDSLN